MHLQARCWQDSGDGGAIDKTDTNCVKKMFLKAGIKGYARALARAVLTVQAVTVARVCYEQSCDPLSKEGVNVGGKNSK